MHAPFRRSNSRPRAQVVQHVDLRESGKTGRAPKTHSASKKTSKVETLRCSAHSSLYAIGHLAERLEG